ncbi:MAG: hypothetical protein GWN51_08950, partial [Gemmatimonadetes bacterium]|nr:hypothetical protein [Gemmatimonadota bacterium]NIT66965.1 hypothetical protein [Gemmatimonadota bacterium]NIV23766.1 hypothetical protein [Gemmatimonadota bacterium]NIW75645.1 hypothetical protein [Gemmatimonadota bacterium]NIY35542.1 hypothetical protein [Gemmatimonadota bacterium]
PLLARCQRISCLELATATHSAAGLDFDVAPNGSLFFSSAGDGIIFPRGSGNGYASGGAAILAGFLGDFQQSVGAAIYDL